MQWNDTPGASGEDISRASYLSVTPQEISILPKASIKKSNFWEKKGKTGILTDNPEKHKLTEQNRKKAKGNVKENSCQENSHRQTAACFGNRWPWWMQFEVNDTDFYDSDHERQSINFLVFVPKCLVHGKKENL